MCKSQAEGGQRCAAHSLQRMERAAERVKTASAAGNTRERDRQSAKWERAAVDYAATPTGQEAVTTWRDEAIAAGDHRAVGRWDSILRRGTEQRERHQAARETQPSATAPATSPGSGSPWDAIDAEQNARTPSAGLTGSATTEPGNPGHSAEGVPPRSYAMKPATWLRLDQDHKRVSGAFALDKGLWEGRRVAVEFLRERGSAHKRTNMQVVYGTLVLAPNAPERTDQIGVRGPDGGLKVIHASRAKSIFDLSRSKDGQPVRST